MYPAFRLMYYLGFRNVYLLGCDFNMVHDGEHKGKKGGTTYAFEQYKWKGGVVTNNLNYDILSKRFVGLTDHFKHHNFKVWNSTPNSKLTAFPYMDLDKAVKKAKASLPT